MGASCGIRDIPRDSASRKRKTGVNMRITIYWATDNARIIDNIRQRFGIVEGMTVNGENIVTVTDDGLAELRKYEADGFIQLRNK